MAGVASVDSIRARIKEAKVFCTNAMFTVLKSATVFGRSDDPSIWNKVLGRDGGIEPV